MNIQTVIPTRGLIHAQTIESLKTNGINGFLIIEGLGIPDAQNEAVKRALGYSPEHILFVEDDTVMPDGALEAMIKLDKPIVAVDYPVDNGYSTICRKSGEILWCGLGCTLINASIFKKIPSPWFETDHSWRIKEDFELERIENPSKYGGQDINFCMKARKWGYTITQLEGKEAKHMRVKSLERQDRTNSGSYEIYELPAISKYQNY